jgi:hypothetical protein
MGIKLEIQLEALADPAVARALSQLVLALGESSPTALQGLVREAERPAAPAVAPRPAPAPVAAPAPAPEAARPAPAPEPAPAPRAVTPARIPAARPAPAAEEDAPLSERWRDFVAQLPERSRHFLDLVREKGVLPIDEAMTALDIHVPKAMGGITGSIGRWAPVRRVPIPYEAVEMPDGRRAWRWTGIGDLEETRPKQAPRKARTPVKAAVARPAATPRASSGGRGSSGGKAGAKEPAPAKPASSASEEGPAPAGAARNPNYGRFLQALPDKSQRFMQLLESRGRMSMSEVLEAFSLNRAKAVGGIIEPIKRIAEQHGVWPVYEATNTTDGGRLWTWHPQR